MQELVVGVTKLFFSVADVIHAIVTERDASNIPGDELPPVLPHQLFNLNLRGFNTIFSGQMPRLQKKFTQFSLIFYEIIKKKLISNMQQIPLMS